MLFCCLRLPTVTINQFNFPWPDLTPDQQGGTANFVHHEFEMSSLWVLGKKEG